MTIRCVFDGRDSTLRPYEYYALSQNDNMSSVLYIECEDVPSYEGEKYFYIDFACYNTRGVLKSKYVSPKLYADASTGNISFVIPNCLTQHVGFVTAQLVMCVETASSPVSKSVMRGDRIFDVRPSVNTLETAILETPNIYDELEQALEDFKSQSFRRAVFCDYDKIVALSGAIVGKKLSAPSFSAPNGNTFKGWYCRESEELWDFDTDTVPAGGTDLVFYAEYYNDSAVLSGQTIKFSYLGDSAEDKVYVPFASAKTAVFELPRSSEDSPSAIAYSDTVTYTGYGAAAEYRIPYGSTKYASSADGLYDAASGKLLVSKTPAAGELRLSQDCRSLGTAILKETPAVYVDLGDGIRSLESGTLSGSMTQILRLGKSVEKIAVASINMPNLHHVIVDRMTPPDYMGIGDIMASDVKLYVPAGAVARYQAHSGFSMAFSSVTSIESASDMAIDEDELEAAQNDLDEYNAGNA